MVSPFDLTDSGCGLDADLLAEVDLPPPPLDLELAVGDELLAASSEASSLPPRDLPTPPPLASAAPARPSPPHCRETQKLILSVTGAMEVRSPRDPFLLQKIMVIYLKKKSEMKMVRDWFAIIGAPKIIKDIFARFFFVDQATSDHLLDRLRAAAPSPMPGDHTLALHSHSPSPSPSPCHSPTHDVDLMKSPSPVPPQVIRGGRNSVQQFRNRRSPVVFCFVFFSFRFP